MTIFYFSRWKTWCKYQQDHNIRKPLYHWDGENIKNLFKYYPIKFFDL